jgi:hypothetical protein
MGAVRAARRNPTGRGSVCAVSQGGRTGAASVADAGRRAVEGGGGGGAHQAPSPTRGSKSMKPLRAGSLWLKPREREREREEGSSLSSPIWRSCRRGPRRSTAQIPSNQNPRSRVEESGMSRQGRAGGGRIRSAQIEDDQPDSGDRGRSCQARSERHLRGGGRTAAQQRLRDYQEPAGPRPQAPAERAESADRQDRRRACSDPGDRGNTGAQQLADHHRLVGDGAGA